MKKYLVILVCLFIPIVIFAQFQYGIYPKIIIDDFILNKEKNQIEIVKRRKEQPTVPARSDIIWKEVYGVIDGKIKLIGIWDEIGIPKEVTKKVIIIKRIWEKRK